MIASLFENFFRIELGMKNEDTISKLAKQRASELSYMTPLDAVIQLRKRLSKNLRGRMERKISILPI